MDLPKGTQHSMRLPRIGVGGPDVRLRLVRADEAGESARPSGADPFVDVSPPDATFRAYLAELRLGDSGDPRPLVLLLEPNERPSAYANQPLWTTSHVASAWSSGFQAMRAAAGIGLARIDVSSGEEVPHHPPVAYCPVSDAYAIPFCPGCLGPLTTCRDEESLRRSGLPSFESGNDRFLHCPACLADNTRPNVFYTHRKRLTGTPAAGIEVRHRHELYADIAPRVPVSDPGFATHGCFVCKTLRASLPETAKLELPAHDASGIFPLAYYDFDYMVREGLPLGFEESAEILGGASIHAVIEQRASRRGLALSSDGRAVVESLTGDIPQFFFQGDRTGLFPLETLYLKLSSFGELLDGVLRLRTAAGRPHLGLSPYRMRGVLRGRDTHLPARWGLSLCVTDALSTTPISRIGEHDFPMQPPIWLVPEPRVGSHLPVPMTRAQTVNLQMRLDARTVELQGSADTARARLAASLQSEVYTPTDHGQHDRVLVSVIGPASGHRIRFVGHRTGTLPGGFAFSGTSGPLRAADAEALRTPQVLSGSAAEVTLVHQYDAPSDLLALGLLYFRLLFWNDRQDAANLGRDLLQRLALRLTGRDRGETHSRGLFEWNELEEILGEEKVAFGPNTILHRAEDRETKETLPLSLWSEVWVVGLRMASFVPGWSFAAGMDDYEPKDPGAALRRAREAVRALADQARASLIGSSGRNRFVLEAAQDFLDDLVEAQRTRGLEERGADETMVAPRRAE